VTLQTRSARRILKAFYHLRREALKFSFPGAKQTLARRSQLAHASASCGNKQSEMARRSAYVAPVATARTETNTASGRKRE
jgi:hypothetical protein